MVVSEQAATIKDLKAVVLGQCVWESVSVSVDVGTWVWLGPRDSIAVPRFACARTCVELLSLRYPAVTPAELEAQTQHLRARADKADSSSEVLAQANAALAARDTQLQEATGEIERLGDLAQVCVCVSVVLVAAAPPRGAVCIAWGYRP